ncbi:MAG: hypothetical protein WC879_04635 [Melioribacteraceae bacterium]
MANKGNKNNVESNQDNQNDFNKLIDVMSIISRTLGVLAVRLTHTRPKTEGERVLFLDSLGFDRNEIAAILSGDPKTISVHLSQQKKSKKNKGTKHGKN